MRDGRGVVMTITVERHSHDGFTLWGTDSEGYVVHRRFMGYTLREAKAIFARELA